MTRDALVLSWMAVVVGICSVLIYLQGAPTGGPALLLGSSPWWGMAIALVVALLGGFPTWDGFAGRARRELTQLGERWTLAQGAQAFKRLLLVHLSAYALTAMAWASFGPPQVVDLSPYLQGQGFTGVVECSTAAGAPETAQWAIAAMCHWSVWQWLPLALGGLLLALGTAGAFWLRADRGDLMAVEIDGQGLVLEYESKTRRIALDAIAQVALEEEGLELVLRGGERLPMSLRGLSTGDIGLLADGIGQRLSEEVVIDPDARARLAKMRGLE